MQKGPINLFSIHKKQKKTEKQTKLLQEKKQKNKQCKHLRYLL